jgi:hypothetical protein
VPNRNSCSEFADHVLNLNTKECHHKTDEERALTGTCVIDEVRLAVQKGYRILEIHEVYEYVT